MKRTKASPSAEFKRKLQVEGEVMDKLEECSQKLDEISGEMQAKEVSNEGAIDQIEIPPRCAVQERLTNNERFFFDR